MCKELLVTLFRVGIYPLSFKVLDFSGNLNDFRQGEERKHSHSIFLFFNAP